MNLIPFEFETKAVRVVQDERGEPWFVGKDVCEALGYADPTTAIRSHCRGVQKLHPIPDALGYPAAPQMTRNLDDEEKGSFNVGIQRARAQYRGATEWSHDHVRTVCYP